MARVWIPTWTLQWGDYGGGGERPTLLFHDTSKVSNCASSQVPAQCHSSGDANHTHFHILHFAMQKRVWIARRDSQITSVGAGASLGMRLCKLAVSCHGQCSCNECLMLECSRIYLQHRHTGLYRVTCFCDLHTCACRSHQLQSTLKYTRIRITDLSIHYASLRILASQWRI